VAVFGLSQKNRRTRQGQDDMKSCILFRVATLAIGAMVLSNSQVEAGERRTHFAAVVGLEFSSEGSLLASVHRDGSIKIWRTRDGSLAGTLSHTTDRNLCIAVSPKEDLIATGTEDGLIRIWRTGDGSLWQTLVGHPGGVESIAFSPSRSYLASAGGDAIIRIWDPHDGKLIHSWKAHEGPARALAFSPRGNLLASGAMDNRVKFWNALRGFEFERETLRVSNIRGLAFSPDGSLLASSGFDGSGTPTVQLWHSDTGLFLGGVTGHEEDVRSLAFAPDGKMLALGGADGEISVWKLRLSAEVAYDAQLVSRLEGHSGEVTGLFFCREGNRLASGSLDSTIREWDLNSSALTRTLRSPAPVSALAVLENGARLAAGHYAALNGEAITFWNWTSGRLSGAYELRGRPVTAIAFAPDFSHLAGAGDDHIIRIWNLNSGSLVRTLVGHRGPITTLAYSPDGERLASEQEDGSIKLWQVALGRIIERFSFSADTPFRLGFSAAGDVVRDAPDGLQGEGLGRRPALSPDGRILARVHEETSIQLLSYPDKEPLHNLVDESMVKLVVRADATPVFRLDRAPIGKVRLVAAEECGEAADGRCATSTSFILLRFESPGEPLTVHHERVEIRSTRPEVVGDLTGTIWPDTVALRLQPGVDLASGDEICISGLRVSSERGVYGSGRHTGWRLNRESKQWEMREFALIMNIFPRLKTAIHVSARSIPASQIDLQPRETRVARKATE
jgi:WD40 repeat protein